MKTIKAALLLVCFFTQQVCLMQAQDAKTDFVNLNKAYHNTKGMSMNMRYSLFENHVALKPQEQVNAIVKRSGEYVYYKLENVEFVHTPKYNLMVNHQLKRIMLGEHTMQFELWDEINYTSKLDEYLKICSKNVYSENGNTATYDLYLNKGQYSRVKIVFEKKTYMIQQMVFFSNVDQDITSDRSGKKSKIRLEINFSNVQAGIKIPEKEFSIQNYLDKSKDKYVCKPAYSGYKLDVQLLSGKK